MTAFTTTARSAKRTRQTLLRTAVLTLAVMVAAANDGRTGCSPPSPGSGLTGSIELAGVTALRSGPSGMTYGDSASFDAKVSGKMAPGGYVHIRAGLHTRWQGRLQLPAPLMQATPFTWSTQQAQASTGAAPLMPTATHGSSTAMESFETHNNAYSSTEQTSLLAGTS